MLCTKLWNLYNRAELTVLLIGNYASPSSGEAYRDRQLTTNFEFWVEIFCVPTCFHMRIPKPCLSVCPSVRPSVHLSVPWEKKSPWLRQYQSYFSNWYINGKSSRVLHHGNPKIWKKIQKSSKFEFWLVTKSWNHLSFVNISRTLAIDTSMERSLRVLHHAHGKCEFYKIKVAKARKISSVKRHFPRLFIGVM